MVFGRLILIEREGKGEEDYGIIFRSLIGLI